MAKGMNIRTGKVESFLTIVDGYWLKDATEEQINLANPYLYVSPRMPQHECNIDRGSS